MKKIVLIIMTIAEVNTCIIGSIFLLKNYPKSEVDIPYDEVDVLPYNITVNDDSEKELTSELKRPLDGINICIDAGHGITKNKYQEKIAPNSDTKKPAFVSGTHGISLSEEELNLIISQKLSSALSNLGANVSMTRMTHETAMSNIDRAMFANSTNSDLSIKIHADGSENKNIHGISILVPDNEYINDFQLCEQSRKAASAVLDSLIASTGAKNRGIVSRNDMTGFNWSKVPVILIEMGFMSNRAECELLESEEYQEKIVEGITNGIVYYFSNN